MAIERINEEKCIGCGECVKSCIADVIRMDEARKKAVIAYPEDCAVCSACVFDCPTDAVYVNLSQKEALLQGW